MPAGSITAGPKSVTRAMGAVSLRRGTIASADQATTSTVVKAPLVRASLVKRRYNKYHLKKRGSAGFCFVKLTNKKL